MAKITKGNPYTHYEETRESWNNSGGEASCDWCGQYPRVLFSYNEDSRRVCNKECFAAYHGVEL